MSFEEEHLQAHEHLPSGAKAVDLLGGWDVRWHGPIENAFAGTRVAVVILVADKPR